VVTLLSVGEIRRRGPPQHMWRPAQALTWFLDRVPACRFYALETQPGLVSGTLVAAMSSVERVDYPMLIWGKAVDKCAIVKTGLMLSRS
jgi:hypothetical protein